MAFHMNVNLLSPIYSGINHPKEKYPFLRGMGHLFDFGQPGYTIRAVDLNTLELVQRKGTSPSWMNTLLKVVAILTVIIPLICLLGTLIYRSVNRFQMINEQEVSLPQEIQMLIASKMNLSVLLLLRGASKQFKQVVETILSERLALGEITFDDLGINRVKDAKRFFKDLLTKIDLTQVSRKNKFPREDVNGYQCSEQEILKKFNRIFDQSPKVISLDIGNIAIDKSHNVPWERFTNILHLKYYKLPPALYKQIAKITSLESLTLNGGKKPNPHEFKLFSSLKKLKVLKIDEVNYEIFKEICATLPQLKTLGAFPVRDVQVFNEVSLLTNLTYLKFGVSDDILEVAEGDSLDSLSRCKKLRYLKIDTAHAIPPQELLHLTKSTQLRLLSVDGIVGYKYNPEWFNAILSATEKLTNLRALSLPFNDDNLIKITHLTGLKCLDLNYCPKAWAFTQLQSLKALRTLNIQDYARKFKEEHARTIVSLPKLEYLNASDNINTYGFTSISNLLEAKKVSYLDLV